MLHVSLLGEQAITNDGTGVRVRSSRGACLHWLPYWLPKIYLPSLTFE